MRRYILTHVFIFACAYLLAQMHITIDNPNTWSTAELSPYIGQTVIFDVPMIVCTNANGNYTVSPWRKYQPQSHGFAGTADYISTVRINSSCMFSLSGVSGYHRCGERIIGLKAKVTGSGSLSMQGGTWSGNTRADLEARLPELGEYRLLVCGFNLENYYMTWGSMGASSYSEHQDQRAKISKALKRINADIYGLVELQQGDEAIQEIVNDLNKNLPGRNYKFFHDASAGTFQKVDFVYDANTVEPLSDKPAETNVETQNRKKIMCFRELATGERFNYSINHFKAMNTGDEDRRVNEATAVVELYKSYSNSKSVREKDVLIMGDLNCYAFTEPIRRFTTSGMIDLHRAFHADSSYSYMYGGLASYIDHALCNETMYRQITGMAAFHINSDEDDRYTYDKSSDNTMFRCSDHDPVLVGLKLDSTLIYDPSPSVNSVEIIQNHLHTMTIRDAFTDASPSYYAIFTTRGDQLQMQPITSSFQEVQLPETSGLYILYIYFDGQVYQRKFLVP
ncbi:MAG: hypothetical protein IK073_03025 [Paludibacteraceae bacterium]|nr:hypothetical protein [Paludibacteraceae bacterium]